MKLSIIIPCHIRNFDDKQFLNALLLTIPDRFDFEVIVVNDHSPLGIDLVSPFKKTSFFIVSSDGYFAGRARNTGIKRACGEWIVFADADDLFVDGALSLCLDLNNDGVDIVYGGVSAFCDKGKSLRVLGYQVLLDISKDDWRFLFRYHPPWGKIIRRSFLEKSQALFGSSKVSNDVLFNARLLIERPRLRILDVPFYKVRDHDRSLTKTVTVETVCERVEVLSEYNRLLRQNGFGAFQVERIKQLRSLSVWHAFIVLKLLWQGWRFGEPVVLTPVSRFLIKERKKRKSF